MEGKVTFAFEETSLANWIGAWLITLGIIRVNNTVRQSTMSDL